MYVQAVSGSKHYCRICVKIVNLFKFDPSFYIFDPFLYRFDPFWTDLTHFGQIEPFLDRFDPIWSKKITLFMLFLIRRLEIQFISSLIHFDQFLKGSLPDFRRISRFRNNRFFFHYLASSFM